MACCGSASSLEGSIEWIDVWGGSPTIVPARATAVSARAVSSIPFSGTRAAISGWAAWLPVSTGSISATVVSSITPTIPLILTA